jgi:hypothetical protein
MKIPLLILLGSTLIVSACATVPDGPSRMALPGSTKNFDQFRADDASCRQYGFEQSGASAKQAGNDSMVKSAAVGTAVGAVLGAAVGGHGAAAFGAGTGLLVGTVAGADAAQTSSYTVQQRYDNAYLQCMYAKGNKVPMAASEANQRRVVQSYSPPPPSAYYPPPPPPPGYY